MRPLSVLCCVCGVPGHLAPVHRCARSVCCFACAVFRATWLLFTGVPARCVALRVRCPGPLGSCSPVCPLGVLLCVCVVLGHLAPVHRCARSVCCVTCPSALPAVSSSVFPLLLSFRRLVLLCLFFLFWGGGLAGVRRFWCCAWVWVCAGAGAGVGTGVVGDGGRVAAALWVPCLCAGPQASGFQGASPGGADGGWLAAVVAWRLRGWSRLLGSAWVAWLGAGVRVGVFMALADRVVGSVGVAGLSGLSGMCAPKARWVGLQHCGCCNGWRRCARRLRGGCCRRRNGLVLLTWVLQVMRRAATGLMTLMVS